MVTNNLTNTQIQIIQLIIIKNNISTSIMAENIGISRRKIFENIKKLKEKNIITRVGSTKTGYWELIE